MTDALIRVSKVAHSQNHAVNIKMMILHASTYGLLMISSIVLIIQTFVEPLKERFQMNANITYDCFLFASQLVMLSILKDLIAKISEAFEERSFSLPSSTFEESL